MTPALDPKQKDFRYKNEPSTASRVNEGPAEMQESVVAVMVVVVVVLVVVVTERGVPVSK